MNDQLVTILRVAKPQLGSFVKDRFEAEGIECFFTNEGLTLGSDYNPDEVLLKVKVKQSEFAIKTLLQLHKEYDLDKILVDQKIGKLKKIMVPLNLGDNYMDTCMYAFNLALKVNAELKFLYVYPDPVIDYSKHTTSWEKHVNIELKEAQQKAQERLVEFSAEIRNKIPKELQESVKFHYRMLKGNPVKVIICAAQRYKPDLIVMKINKSVGTQKVLERTIAKVIEHSNFPVMALSEMVSFKGKEKINVMYATDFYDKDNSSLNKLLSILDPYDKKIHCVHIDLHDDPLHNKKVSELNAMLDKEYSEHNIHCELFESDNITQGFHDFVEKNDIDLISFSKMKRSSFYKIFHTSLLEKLVSIEKVPFLIFPV